MIAITWSQIPTHPTKWLVIHEGENEILVKVSDVRALAKIKPEIKSKLFIADGALCTTWGTTGRVRWAYAKSKSDGLSELRKLASKCSSKKHLYRYTVAQLEKIVRDAIVDHEETAHLHMA